MLNLVRDTDFLAPWRIIFPAFGIKKLRRYQAVVNTLWYAAVGGNLTIVLFADTAQILLANTGGMFAFFAVSNFIDQKTDRFLLIHQSIHRAGYLVKNSDFIQRGIR